MGDFSREAGGGPITPARRSSPGARRAPHTRNGLDSVPSGAPKGSAPDLDTESNFLWNIPYHVADFQKEVPRYMVKHQVKPGVTGLAQVSGWRGNTSIEKRIEYDIYYIENWTLILDIFILFKTLCAFKNNEKLASKKKNGILFAACESCNTLENKNEATADDNVLGKKEK